MSVKMFRVSALNILPHIWLACRHLAKGQAPIEPQKQPPPRYRHNKERDTMAKKIEDAREHKMFFRLNDKEYLTYLNNLEKANAAEKVTSSDFIRMSVLSQPVTEKKAEIIDGLMGCVKELNKMGNNINQVAKWLNEYRIECKSHERHSEISKAEPYLNELVTIRKTIGEIFTELDVSLSYYYSSEE